MVGMQESADAANRSGGGGMGSPQRAGMASGVGHGLHTAAPVRHSPPPSSSPSPSPGITPSQSAQGGAPAVSTPVPEAGPSGLHPHPIMAVAPPASLGMSLGIVGTSITGPRSASGGEQPLKRKRGRPRKFSTGSEFSPGTPGAGYPVFPAIMPAPSSPYTPSPDKRGRGRPTGSGKRQQLAALGNFLVIYRTYSCIGLFFCSGSLHVVIIFFWHSPVANHASIICCCVRGCVSGHWARFYASHIDCEHWGGTASRPYYSLFDSFCFHVSRHNGYG